MASSVPITQWRLVLNISVTGAQANLIDHGRYMEPVYSAMSVFETPRFLYMSAATTLTVIIGKPSAK
jgi:hypothetical protein